MTDAATEARDRLAEAGCFPADQFVEYELAHRLLQAALATPTPAGELREVDGWQPIATAPKDGTEVMVWAVDEEAYDDAEDEADFQQRPYPARCNFQGIWWLSGGCMKILRLATHWRPLLTGPCALAQPGSGEGV